MLKVLPVLALVCAIAFGFPAGRNPFVDLAWLTPVRSASAIVPLKGFLNFNWEDRLQRLKTICANYQIDHSVFIGSSAIVFRVYGCENANKFIWLISGYQTNGTGSGINCEQVLDRSFNFCFKNNENSCLVSIQFLDTPYSACCFESKSPWVNSHNLDK